MSFSIKSAFSKLGRTGLLLALLFCGYAAVAQESADKIIAIVGRNRIILQSELALDVMQMQQANPDMVVTDSTKGVMLYSKVMQNMLLEQAERDSVMVSDDDVEGQLDNRLRYFIQLYGSKEKLEQASGKTIYQIKEENRDAIRNQMVAEKLQNTILDGVKVTPAEVNDFYNKLPKDQLPFFPATVEVGQIVIDPKVNPEMEDYAKNSLNDIRQEIIDGKKSFEMAATSYSQDPGSRDNGGRYDGITRNGPWAPEFIAAAFRLQNDEISPVFRTKFGYHIIKMIHRKGDEADVAHILIKPEVTSSDFQMGLNKLDSIRTLLVTGKISFPEAVGKFSTDDGAKRTGGMLANPQTGATELEMTSLDPAMVLMVDSMQVGGYSAPHIFVNESRDRSSRIIYLRSRTVPHQANLKDDYNKVQDVALGHKKQTKLAAWGKEKVPTFYLWLAPEYREFQLLKDMLNTTNATTAAATR